MELEGFKRCMKWLLDAANMAGLAIECIITDRHLQVAKWIRENLTSLQIHFYDIWHISKSLKKKITSLGKKKGNEILNEWCKSIINHLYWSASSTPDGNPELMLEKFLSVINHMQNIHSGHEGTLFNSCAHQPLEGERPRKWLTPSKNILA
ncbi:hypothetical protein HOLleu_10553 [Holothuria leucospilota]|uniref:Uncharacterized protein n=1 Tax=Holothuria leucospilota TaxID=206669 RepID=A0A9Q1CF01_HOLLE|nr:hypothetical protein HOLleu_10553 [Holothuria leucospilota]